MILRIILIFFLWLLIRRVWRSFVVAKTRSQTRGRPYPGPGQTQENSNDLTDITQQEISDADYEDLDDK